MYSLGKCFLTKSAENVCHFRPETKILQTINRQFVSKQISKQEIRKLYQTLGVAEDCEDDVLRIAFVHLAKRFHPDSGTAEASAVRFAEIDTAYREIKRIRGIQKENESNHSDIEEFDIKHTAPQHRHYLMYDMGTGTPSKRQKRYTMERAQKAVDNVMEHRLKKLQAKERNTLVGIDKQKAKDIKTRYGMDRLVEDLIQEAMNKGEFRDLPGMGKPLKDNLNAQNPYVDFVTHKLNEVLIENGFTPEWIQLSKEIRIETQILRDKLSAARNNFPLIPLNPTDTDEWKNCVGNFKPIIKKLNDKIDKYNLLVPVLQKQMVHVNLETLADEILSKPPVNKPKESNSENSSNLYTGQTLMDVFTSIIFKKSR